MLKLPHYVIRRIPQSKRWGIYEVSTGTNILVEGFFSRFAAIEWMQKEYYPQ